MKQEKLYKMASTEEGFEYSGVSFIGMSKAAQIETKDEEYRGTDRALPKKHAESAEKSKKLSKIKHARQMQAKADEEARVAEEAKLAEEVE